MNPLKQTAEYIKSSKAELEKVSWPSRQDTIRYSSLVVVVSLAVALFFAALDFGLGRTIEVVLSTAHRSTSAAPQTPVTAPAVTPDVNEVTPSTVPIQVTPPPAGNTQPQPIKITPEKK